MIQGRTKAPPLARRFWQWPYFCASPEMQIKQAETPRGCCDGYEEQHKGHTEQKRHALEKRQSCPTAELVRRANAARTERWVPTRIIQKLLDGHTLLSEH